MLLSITLVEEVTMTLPCCQDLLPHYPNIALSLPFEPTFHGDHFGSKMRIPYPDCRPNILQTLFAFWTHDMAIFIKPTPNILEFLFLAHFLYPSREYCSIHEKSIWLQGLRSLVRRIFQKPSCLLKKGLVVLDQTIEVRALEHMVVYLSTQ